MTLHTYPFYFKWSGMVHFLTLHKMSKLFLAIGIIFVLYSAIGIIFDITFTEL